MNCYNLHLNFHNLSEVEFDSSKQDSLKEDSSNNYLFEAKSFEFVDYSFDLNSCYSYPYYSQIMKDKGLSMVYLNLLFKFTLWSNINRI